MAGGTRRAISRYGALVVTALARVRHLGHRLSLPPPARVGRALLHERTALLTQRFAEVTGHDAAPPRRYAKHTNAPRPRLVELGRVVSAASSSAAPGLQSAVAIRMIATSGSGGAGAHPAVWGRGTRMGSRPAVLSGCRRAGGARRYVVA